MIRDLKSGIKDKYASQKCWSIYRSHQMSHDYQKRREYYNQLAKEKDITYHKEDVVFKIRSRLKRRGYTTSLRQIGELHTFAFIPQYSWHKHLVQDIKELGPVNIFDYVNLGYSAGEFDGHRKWNKRRIIKKQEMLSKVSSAFREANRQKPVDWFFCYAGGQNMSASLIRQITEEFGVPTVNMTLDDKHGWEGPMAGEECTGARDITSAFDLYITSARVACEWHLVEGGRPIYMPEGFDNSFYHPRDVKKDIQVSFVGVAYGFRQAVVRHLRKYDIPIQVFGKGWPGAGYTEDIVDIFNRSVINLGMGGIGYSENLTNVKGRDFEIPGTGGGVYLTSFNPDLAQHFIIGKEILCYRNRDEMIELVRYYLAHPEEAQEIARRGRERCLREHRWLHRYIEILQILQILPQDTKT